MTDQSQRGPIRASELLEPMQAKAVQGPWTGYLILFLRIMAAMSLVKGLYHWTQICSVGAAHGQGFEERAMVWQAVTIFFAIIDLVAAVGLWLAAAWGAVVWVTSVVCMAAVEVFLPAVYGGSLFIVLTELGLLGIYVWLAAHSARERQALR